MENVMTINAEERTGRGKIVAKKLRKEGKIPAIIYGGDKVSLPVSLFSDEVKNVLKSEKGENTVLRIQRGDSSIDAMLYDIQYHCLSDSIIHVDLLRIDVEKPVSVNVPIKVTGEPIGVKLEDGVFDFLCREVKIKCLVTKIPNDITIDVSHLHSGQSIKADALAVGEDIRLLSDPNTVICSVNAKGKADMVEAVVTPEAAEAPVDAKDEKAKTEDKKAKTEDKKDKDK
ncbi:MAG: 50S ribosomal protein L25 [Candidatus Aminicenantes bacterium]|nr:50S ribosomal protein L25 [Candidatus Aminicenantes bacterium]